MSLFLRGKGALLLAAPLFALTFVPTQIGLRDMTPVGFVVLRFTVSALLTLPFALQSRRREAVEMGPVVPAGLIAGVCLLGVFLCQTAGLLYTTTSNSAFLSSLPVITVPILICVWTRRLPHAAVALGIALALAGTFFLTGATLPLNRGDTITLGVALFGACHILTVGRFAARCAPAPFIALQLAVIVLGAGLLVPFTGGFGSLTGSALAAATVAGGLQAAGLGLQVLGQRSVAPGAAVLLLTCMPVWATGAGLLAGERLAPLGALGAALILGGIAVSQTVPRRAPAAMEQARVAAA